MRVKTIESELTMDHIEQAIQKKTSKNKKQNKKNNQKWAILSISSIPLVMTLGNSMLIPVLPVMEKKLSINSFQVSMIITIYSIVAIFLIPIAGYLSDHIGRKKVIIPSLLIAGIGGIVSGWAAWKLENPYMVILIGRALQGVGAAGAQPIVMPLVGDMFKNDDDVSSSLGLIETSNTFGKVLSPILGALLAGVIWFLPFFSIPVFCLCSIILMLFLVKTPNKREEPIPFKEFFQHIKDIFTQKGKWLYAIFLIGAILMLVLFGILFYLSDLLEKSYHIKNIKKGLLLALPLCSLCASSYITGKLIKQNKILMKWMIFVSCLGAMISVALLSLNDQLWFMIMLFLLCGIGIGAALPCLDAMITEGIEKEQRGTISSIYSSMRFIGVAAGPPITALLLKHAENWMFYIFSLILLIAALATFLAIKPKS